MWFQGPDSCLGDLKAKGGYKVSHKLRRERAYGRRQRGVGKGTQRCFRLCRWESNQIMKRRKEIG